MVINKENFKKLSFKQTPTAQDIRNTTTLDMLLNSPLNIVQTRYREGTDPYIPGVSNYVEFINNNVFTSAKPVKIAENIEGYTRINKRLGVTLEKSFEEMMREDNQELTKITIPDKLSEEEILKLIQQGMDEEEDLLDGLTQTDC